jgi:oligoribonuclease (3'-5' exoribonuclease)
MEVLMPATNLALILDTETTGNVSAGEPNGSELIEIGMVMLDVPSLVQLGEFTIVIEPSPEQFSAMMAKDVVRKMHEANGLLADLIAHKGVPPAEADVAISKWLDQFNEERTHIPYGGSGVAHFDRQYIAAQLPRLNRRITYWALDVGSVRRIFALQGASTHSIDAKTHRALDDAKVHAEELRFYAEAGRLADKYRELTD